ncbi:NAD-dependent epimerase/dehydratase [Beutenbergia cavernae DSM 12333]|uniref:NAD-dependent epimerase/dehydratase n=1 Tax=Beutenbergia cavernae (strain ATCC BAA-8 / DSM 12333 / CCUG 43141 / JCM 11478 / NBRC 16432 / NCIMB 13614 / HKI 0122) TaxID=471853 RepID=C5BZJ7_BEUC1|nr:NAD(P)-dependent oxidoreductase [Beutenbergia cavernae]ACQ79169.1 NAD-dependent epimerase/dehydratase [Beutenbergia cavernae DSM 12333]
MTDGFAGAINGAGRLPLPRHVLVTGADGRIGRSVVDVLAGAGVTTTGLSPGWEAASRATRIVTGDATSEADVADALEGVDAVVHLAAIAHRDLGRPYDVYRTNTDATFNVLAQAGERGIGRAVIASSINAFGVPMNHHDLLPAYFPIDEDIPEHLDDWYSLSKRSDELTAEMVASHWGMTVVAVRFPHVSTWEALRSHAARVAGAPGGGQEVREGWSYLDLRDAAAFVLAALTAPISGAHVVGASAPDTLLAVDSAELLDAHAPSVPRRRPIVGRESLVDVARARTLLGFEARYSLHEPAHDPNRAPTTAGVIP